MVDLQNPNITIRRDTASTRAVKASHTHWEERPHDNGRLWKLISWRSEPIMHVRMEDFLRHTAKRSCLPSFMRRSGSNPPQASQPQSCEDRSSYQWYLLPNGSMKGPDLGWCWECCPCPCHLSRTCGHAPQHQASPKTHQVLATHLGHLKTSRTSLRRQMVVWFAADLLCAHVWAIPFQRTSIGCCRCHISSTHWVTSWRPGSCRCAHDGAWLSAGR